MNSRQMYRLNEFNETRRRRVYVSGPITGGDRNWNQYQANVAHRRLLQAGFAVLNPMPTGVLPFAWEKPEDGGITHEEWLDSDKAWIAVSDMVYRLPGESKGADIEEAFANSIGVPVYTEDTFPWPVTEKAAA